MTVTTTYEEARKLANDMCGGLMGMIRQDPERYWTAMMRLVDKIYELEKEAEEFKSEVLRHHRDFKIIVGILDDLEGLKTDDGFCDSAMALYKDAILKIRNIVG